jgi:hypothetical protein
MGWFEAIRRIIGNFPSGAYLAHAASPPRWSRSGNQFRGTKPKMVEPIHAFMDESGVHDGSPVVTVAARYRRASEKILLWWVWV